MTVKDYFDFIFAVAHQALSFEFHFLDLEISFYNLLFSGLVFGGFFAVLGTRINVGVSNIENSKKAEEQTRKDKIKADNARRNEMIRQAKKDGVPLKK